MPSPVVGGEALVGGGGVCIDGTPLYSGTHRFNHHHQLSFERCTGETESAFVPPRVYTAPRVRARGEENLGNRE